MQPYYPKHLPYWLPSHLPPCSLLPPPPTIYPTYLEKQGSLVAMSVDQYYPRPLAAKSWTLDGSNWATEVSRGIGVAILESG